METAMSKRVLILGGDGYLGWAQAMYLSERGYEVAVLDNMARRQFDLNEGFESLLPIATLHRRAALWHTLTGKTIGVYAGDVCDYEFLSRAFQEFAPDAIVHHGEQRAAPD
jgi:UDP-sulfoquinovose synthase